MTDKLEQTGAENEAKVEQTGAESDVKRKFKEALERKNQAAQARKAHDEGLSKVNGTQGPTARKQNFRRKTG
jgi:hypothetical protein